VLFANVTATYQAVGDQETELRMRRRMEANAAARHLGVKLLVIEDPSGDIPSATRLRDELASLVKTTHPDVVVLPRGSAASLDVSMGMKSALSSAFSAPVAEATSRARQPVCLYYMDQAQAELPETNLVVPIDDVMDQKTSALSEFRAFPTTTYSPSRTDSRALPVPLPTRTSIPLPLQAWVDAGAGAPRSDAEKALVVRLYGEAAVAGIQHLESFGYDDDSQPEESTVRKLTRSSVKP
jgi:LmbE family N-acetylglucosaminyl deacetylase